MLHLQDMVHDFKDILRDVQYPDFKYLGKMERVAMLPLDSVCNGHKRREVFNNSFSIEIFREVLVIKFRSDDAYFFMFLAKYLGTFLTRIELDK